VTLEQYSVSVWNVDSLLDFLGKNSDGDGENMSGDGDSMCGDGDNFMGMGMNVHPRVNL